MCNSCELALFLTCFAPFQKFQSAKLGVDTLQHNTRSVCEHWRVHACTGCTVPATRDTATNHSDGHLFPMDAPVWPGVPRLLVLANVLCEEACGMFRCIARCLSHTPLRDVYTWLFQRVSYFLQDYVSWWAERPDHICWLPMRLCRVRCPTQ